jgi:hypothetical protein
MKTNFRLRITSAVWACGAAFALFSSTAGAVENKGDTGGKGGLGPEATAPKEESPAGPDSLVPIQRQVDTSKKSEQTKPWEIGASFETHRMFIQGDGAGGNKVFNFWGLYALYRLGDHDTLGLQEFMTEGFLVDQGETGVQAQDVALTYTHSVSLPRDFVFSVTGSVSAPTSYTSQKAGLITAPHLSLSLNKKLGRYINVSAHLSGGVFISRYAEQEGGGTNPLGNIGGGLSAEVIMPFHEPLSFGASVSDSYAWFYPVQSSDQNVISNGVVADQTYINQPVFQQYGAWVYGRYTLPALAGAKSDFEVDVGDGDPGIGYNNFLHDGIGYTYLYYRMTGEVYAALTVRY